MKRSNYSLFTSIALSSLLMLGGQPVALANVEKGLEIATERKARDEGWGDSVATMQMILKNAQGESSTREMRLKSLEVADDGDKGLTIFDQPRDVKGTAFLNHSHTIDADDQWLYLPALKRVKRISSRNKSGPFMGSEFAYEDLSSFELEKYTFHYLRDERVNGSDTFVLKQIPTDKNSGYTKQQVWLDKEHYRPIQIEFYDRKGSLLKTLKFDDYQLYLDKYWRAHKMAMTNHQTGKSTLLTTSNLQFQTGLSERDFEKNILKRVK
ncbi:outer membrane lipoprotein-sorting protein [Vibrio sp. Isolate25]|uniref:outer membrane lipoprotein-sorting protein n=1 Tax=unclassified Vibrio TaxID=2614977 RepID=UPI001EFCFEDD|nr:MULTISPECIES: outer membrane lipoprotein-sorting protein [unclassified Vibrio]MCG9597903.1 outer membrane lipoprotein-sorting protein [Vibrio sp. Isolate25]MCG9683160.1 outer membrane lipoprotein-sorting protein [Vibrio sp. Isolate23]